MLLHNTLNALVHDTLKPVAAWHFKSLLLHDTFKARYYTAP